MAWPTFPLDSVSLGLLAVAAILALFDVENLRLKELNLPILGIGLESRIAKAKRQVASAQVSNSVVAPAPPAIVEQSLTLVVPALGGISAQNVGQPTGPWLAAPAGPLERLLGAAELIRIELIVIAGNGGYLPFRLPWQSYKATDLALILAARQVIPKGLQDAISVIAETREVLDDRGPAEDPRVVDRASDLALDVLRKLMKVKRDYQRVRIARVPVFGDEELATRAGMEAVMIEQLNDDGRVTSQHVFPTQERYEAGEYVTWEWDMGRIFRAPAWFRDPDTQTTKQAWQSATSFAGRAYPREWDVRPPGATTRTN
ncbi:MAG TPA: hypothetical protein VNX67_01310 [Solirubrobacteraceae bacterium]|jgi:hypothetical protein|nr:hypothetical protein [Solirubrobacteraceae bacterium]